MNPFKEKGNWYRGNIHAHSTQSDGWVSPQNLAKGYASSGYHFLAITDHWKLTRIDFTANNFLLIPGTELDGGKTAVGDFHFVGLGVTKQIDKTRGTSDKYSAQELIDLIVEAGGIPFLAHPSWNGVTCTDILPLENLLGLEVYNGGCDVEIARGYGDVPWDDLLSRGRNLFCFAVDDVHRVYHDLAKGWIWVKAENLTETAILNAIRSGAFYSSTGPLIHDVELNKDHVNISCSPARRVNLMTNPCHGNALISREGEFITNATIPLYKEMKYIRIEVIDSAGRKAWSNPWFR